MENRENDEAGSLGESRKGFVSPFAVGGDQKGGQNKSLHDECKREGDMSVPKRNVLPKIDHVILPAVIVKIVVFQRDEFGKHLSEISREDGQEGEKRDACLAEGGKKGSEVPARRCGNPGSGPRFGYDQTDGGAVKW